MYVDMYRYKYSTCNYILFVSVVGRRPLLSGMRLDRVGVDLSPVSGRVVVDEEDCSSVARVFAIGDVAEVSHPTLNAPAD